MSNKYEKELQVNGKKVYTAFFQILLDTLYIHLKPANLFLALCVFPQGRPSMQDHI